MNEVHQHPDGLFFIRTSVGTYADTVANAQLDFGETIPALPQGADDRIYRKGVRHAIMSTQEGLIGGGPMPWDIGERMIANIQRGLDAKNLREHPPLTPQQQADKDAADAAAALETSRISSFESEPTQTDLRQRLKDATPAQIDTWLLNNVTNLAQARTVLGAIIKFLVARRLML